MQFPEGLEDSPFILTLNLETPRYPSFQNTFGILLPELETRQPT